MIIIAQRLFASHNGSLVKVQFVDSPPVDFAVWRLEVDGKGATFNTFAELIEHLKINEMFSDDELKEIEKAKGKLLNIGQI